MCAETEVSIAQNCHLRVTKVFYMTTTTVTSTPVVQKIQKQVWNQKTAIRTYQQQFQVKFDMEADAIDLRTMANNYNHGIIPLEDIHKGIMAVLGPNFNPALHQSYDPSDGYSAVLSVPGLYAPRFTYVEWDQLFLYSIFQRDVAPKHCAKLKKDWDHTAVLIPCAIKFTLGGKIYYCIWDGHHTLQTAKLMNYTKFPVWFIDIDAIPSEAIKAAQFEDTEEGRIKYGAWVAGRNMIRINATNKRPLEHYDRFMIQLETEDAHAVAMKRIVDATGCSVKRKAKTARSWTQINSGEECFDLTLGNGLPSNGVFWKHALEFHTTVWPLAPLQLEIYRPLSYLSQAFNVGNYPIDAQFDKELETILTTKYGDPETAQISIKASYNNALTNNLGRGHLLKNDREIVYNGLINLYNQNCGRIVAIPQASYVWQV